MYRIHLPGVGSVLSDGRHLKSSSVDTLARAVKKRQGSGVMVAGMRGRFGNECPNSHRSDGRSIGTSMFAVTPPMNASSAEATHIEDVCSSIGARWLVRVGWLAQR